MKKENIEFLKELQKELTTQDTCYQASPRFWVVRTKERVWEKDTEEDYDIIAYYHDGEIYEMTEMQDILDLEESMMYSLENISGSDSWRKEEIISEFKLLKEEFSKTNNFIDIDIDILKNIFSNMYYADNSGNDWSEDNIYYGHYEWKIAPSTMFLTLKDAQEHCDKNYYHYIKGYPYAMTAWRSPKVRKLLEILETENFDDPKENEISIGPTYIGRVGLQNLRNFIALDIVGGDLFLENLEKRGIKVWDNEIVIEMDSLGHENRFKICDSSQMTNEECEKTVKTLSVLLECNWIFKERI